MELKRKFIKLNNNNNHLSLGNFCRVIKELSVNKVFATQTEIFCAIFNIEDANDSTINNYCIGYRSIGEDYKEVFYKARINENSNLLIQNVLNILSILDGKIYEYSGDSKSIMLINSSLALSKLANSMYNISKNDNDVDNEFIKKLRDCIDSSNLYDGICLILDYIILIKKQPIYIEKIVNDAIENILNKTNISITDLQNFLNAEFMDGINYIYSLKKMATVDNPYALFELGMMEYNGEFTGKPRYNKCYEYFKRAADKNHPRANFMIASLIYNKEIGNLESKDIELAFKHLDLARNAGSIAAINLMGLFYLNGLVDNKKDVDKAIILFEEACSHNYTYAYNNLGKIYEDKMDYEKAFTFYKESADLEQSWACNKIGNFYRLGIGCGKDLKKAFYYYNLSMNAPIKTFIDWSKYNLAKYFYLNGCYDIGLEKDVKKAISLLKDIEDNNIDACILLL